MSGHTPEPWVVKPHGEHPELHTIWRGLTGFETLIARTCFAPASEANARLIAAAPDMEKAIVAIRDRHGIIEEKAMPEEIGGTYLSPAGYMVDGELLKALFDALPKATTSDR